MRFLIDSVSAPDPPRGQDSGDLPRVRAAPRSPAVTWDDSPSFVTLSSGGDVFRIDRLRDRVLFETIYVCGARAAEVCGLDLDDFDLRQDDEHVRIHGKSGTVRTVLLDDHGYVALLKLSLNRAGHQFGPAFRASINGNGGPLSHDAAHHRWEGYCEVAGVEIDIHRLRHAHATELINAGVSIEVVRRRLGHASTETTQLPTLLADAEIRAARRRRDRRQPASRMLHTSPAAIKMNLGDKCCRQVPQPRCWTPRDPGWASNVPGSARPVCAQCQERQCQERLHSPLTTARRRRSKLMAARTAKLVVAGPRSRRRPLLHEAETKKGRRGRGRDHSRPGHLAPSSVTASRTVSWA
ncbi:tyrosine-type recombinase/integrase [Streptosporangium sp. CA-135522]|uniref:tyrosine-type recombinase/integrase n=1 Tax=Streptosporangium sp. CA-135522 TaxID=3240072 RepID=UPI003D919C25